MTISRKLRTGIVVTATVTATATGPAPAALADVIGGRTVRVSISSAGAQADDSSGRAAISYTGRYVAFSSFATNLVPGDTNNVLDVFLHDRLRRSTQRVSVASDGTQANVDSSSPAITADGGVVAFGSAAHNLVPGDTNGQEDVFVHDRRSGRTERISVASDGSQGDGSSSEPAISASGRYILFSSFATNLVPGDTNARFDAFVHDRRTGRTERISVASDGSQADGSSIASGISADGRHIVFLSTAANLVAGDTNGRQDAFVHDRRTGRTERVSLADDGSELDRDSFSPSISADGRYVSFDSEAGNAVPGDTNAQFDVFVRDRRTGRTERVSVSVSASGAQGNGFSGGGTFGAGGRYVSFLSEADNLVPGDTNAQVDVFVRDRRTRSTIRVSVASDGSQANGPSVVPMISANGRHVVFASEATNLVPGDTNGRQDVFVRTFFPRDPWYPLRP